MAFFRNYSNNTVSRSLLEEKTLGQSVERIHSSTGNEDMDVNSYEKECDINMDVQYQSEGEHEDASRLHNEAAEDEVIGTKVSNLPTSGRRTAVAGKWGSTFWKDCQPMRSQGGSDSGQETKSGLDYRNAVGSEDNSSDVREDGIDFEDEGKPKVSKGQRGSF
ncbi:protein CHROMATIN REMODELING 5-like [Pyrus x bretschneideri]|uniref:protein CHROMATIN REMODELING 5-like n=1 Tax=Pyrus x bretschneideri TaxID=225117 RepID=UPI0020302E71|nr:protein CHROMATIN REMODELING 5-like [Pyrus x bretschneideri]